MVQAREPSTRKFSFAQTAKTACVAPPGITTAPGTRNRLLPAAVSVTVSDCADASSRVTCARFVAPSSNAPGIASVSLGTSTSSTVTLAVAPVKFVAEAESATVCGPSTPSPPTPRRRKLAEAAPAGITTVYTCA